MWWKLLIEQVGNIFGSDEKGKSQVLELLKGQKQKERDYELAMEQKHKELFEIKLKEVQNARSMQIEALNQEDLFTKRFVPCLTLGIMAIAGLLGVFPMFLDIPESSMPMINEAQNFWYMIAGGSCIGFFYGTNTKR